MANFDKSLYQAPAGLDELAKAEDGIEIEIVDPENSISPPKQRLACMESNKSSGAGNENI